MSRITTTLVRRVVRVADAGAPVMRHASAALGVVGALLRLAAGAQALAQEPTRPGVPACDASVIPGDDADTRYQTRGDRCEGFYYLPRTGTPVIPVSYLAAPVPIFQIAPPSLALRWRLPLVERKDVGAVVHIRALVTTGGYFYRMDHDATPGDSEYVWPLQQFRWSGLNVSDVEISAWLETRNPDKDIVLVPVTVGGVLPRDSGMLRLFVEQPLHDVRYSLVPLWANRDDSAVVRDSLLGNGHFGTNTRVIIRIPTSLPGLYRVVLSCKLAGDVPWTYLLRLFVPS